MNDRIVFLKFQIEYLGALPYLCPDLESLLEDYIFELDQLDQLVAGSE